MQAVASYFVYPGIRPTLYHTSIESKKRTQVKCTNMCLMFVVVSICVFLGSVNQSRFYPLFSVIKQGNSVTWISIQMYTVFRVKWAHELAKNHSNPYTCFVCVSSWETAHSILGHSGLITLCNIVFFCLKQFFHMLK